MKNFKIKQIIIDNKIKSLPMTQSILKKNSNAEIIYTNDIDATKEDYKTESLTFGEKILLVTENKGNLTKLCPGITKEVVCCNYYVINSGMGCPIDCTYCFLQEYLNSPILTVYANIEKTYEEVNAILENSPKRVFRFGTGELTDSLVLDPITESSRSLIKFFGNKKNVLLELKTKTTFINHLLSYPGKNIVFSWSLNPDEIIVSEEHKSASLTERLETAKMAQEAGFKLAFHFDPIIYFDNWEKAYRELIERLFTIIRADNIVWISLGTLRYPPGLKGVIQERFPKSTIIYSEQTRGMDGKMRYIKPIRQELYKKIYGMIKEKSREVFCYFCMETWDMWQKAMGYYPKGNGDLDYRFAVSLKQRFPDLELEEPDIQYYL